MNAQRSSRLHSQSGISFVEILVAMGIGVIILGGVMQSMITNQRNNGWSDDVAFIQENARYALEILGRDMRWGGYWGCAVNTPDAGDGATIFGNALDVAANHDWFKLEGVQAWEGATQVFPDGLVDGVQLWADNANFVGNDDFTPDAIIFRGGSADLNVPAERHRRGGARFDFFINNPFDAGDLILAVSEDCKQVGLAQVSEANANRILHREGGADEPGNCTRAMRGGEPFICGALPGSYTAFGAGTTVMPFEAVGYYVGTSGVDNEQPALYRAVYTEMTGGAISVQTDEIAMGVEDMQFLFGFDNDGDGLANLYLRPDEIDAALGEWKQVVSIRVSLLMRGYADTREDAAAVNYIGFPYAGADDGYTGQAYNDRILRQQVSKTVRVRNTGEI